MINERYQSNPASKVGHVSIDVDNDFSATVLLNTEKAVTLPINATVKKVCELHDTFSQPTGTITLYISMSCFGKTALTQFWLSRTGKDQYKCLQITKAEEDIKKRIGEIKEEECHLQPLIADYEYIMGFHKKEECDEDKYLYKKKTFEWEKYVEECDCYGVSDKNQSNVDDSIFKRYESLCGNNVLRNDLQLQNKYNARLTDELAAATLRCKQRPKACTRAGDDSAPGPLRLPVSYARPSLLASRRSVVCPFDEDVCTCKGQCNCKLPGAENITPNAGKQRPQSHCPFNKNVCKCSGKCDCKMPEVPQSLRPYIANGPNKDDCPFNKDICKCSGKCPCEPLGIDKHFSSQNQAGEKMQYKSNFYNSYTPQPEWSKSPCKPGVAELDHKFRAKDVTNTQLGLDPCPCPFKAGCPFC